MKRSVWVNWKGPLPFKKEDVVWWELFPALFGNTVKVKKTGEMGKIIGLTVPLYHTGRFEIVVEKYLLEDYEIWLDDDGRRIKLKRWEFDLVG